MKEKKYQGLGQWLIRVRLWVIFHWTIQTKNKLAPISVPFLASPSLIRSYKWNGCVITIYCELESAQHRLTSRRPVQPSYSHCCPKSWPTCNCRVFFVARGSWSCVSLVVVPCHHSNQVCTHLSLADICSTSLFVKSWVCSSCGQEICYECKDMLGSNVKSTFIFFPMCSSDMFVAVELLSWSLPIGLSFLSSTRRNSSPNNALPSGRASSSHWRNETSRPAWCVKVCISIVFIASSSFLHSLWPATHETMNYRRQRRLHKLWNLTKVIYRGQYYLVCLYLLFNLYYTTVVQFRSTSRIAHESLPLSIVRKSASKNS